MDKVIQQFIDDEWYDLLKNSGKFRHTEAGKSYVDMFVKNLVSSLKLIDDTRLGQSEREHARILLANDFQEIGDNKDCRIYYKYGRLVVQHNNDLYMIYQYSGNVPKKLRASKTIGNFDGIYFDYSEQSTGLIIINKFMENNGKFLEPWNVDLFDIKGQILVKEVRKHITNTNNMFSKGGY